MPAGTQSIASCRRGPLRNHQSLHISMTQVLQQRQFGSLFYQPCPIQKHQIIFHVLEGCQQDPSAQDSRSRFVKAAKGQEFGSLKLHYFGAGLGMVLRLQCYKHPMLLWEDRQIPLSPVLSSWHTYTLSQRGWCHCPTDCLCCVAFHYLTLSKALSRLIPKLTLICLLWFRANPTWTWQGPIGNPPCTPGFLPLARPSTRGPSGLWHFTR